MKGIVLAGGRATRMGPVAEAVSKHLLPVYDKPMIYYPLSTLMLADIRQILLISTPYDIIQYKRLLGDGSRWGLEIGYCVQESPRGLAEALILGESFIGADDFILILGDNIFYGVGFSSMLHRAAMNCPCIFAYPVSDPRAFGVVEIDENDKAISIEEKPAHPKSKYAVPGLYFYPASACKIAEILTPSNRGELEITDLNRILLESGKLNVVKMGRGMAWLDTGTPEGLLAASQFVEVVQNRQGMHIACLEEIAFSKGYIDNHKLLELCGRYASNKYGEYLRHLAQM